MKILFQTKKVDEARMFLEDQQLLNLVEQFDMLQIIAIDSEQFTNVLHENGINMKYLGKLLKLTKLPYLREFSLIQMVSRCTKLILNRELRGTIKHLRKVQANRVEDEIKLKTLQVLSGLFGSISDQQRFFSHSLKSKLFELFGLSDITWEEIKELPKIQLSFAIQYHVNDLIRLTKRRRRIC